MDSLQSLEHQENLQKNYAKGNQQKSSYVNTATSLSELSDETRFTTDEFFVYKDENLRKCSILLNSKSLTIMNGKDTIQAFPLDDVLGVTFKRDSKNLEKLRLDPENFKWMKNGYALKIHSFAKPVKEEIKANEDLTSLPPERKYEKFILYHDNHILIEQWKNLILHAANNPNFQNISKTEITAFPKYKRHLLVFVMSKSGQGKAEERWQTCRKLLVKGGCTFHEMFIEDFKVLKDFLEKSTAKDLNQFDVIASVSGDGIPHSVINLLMNRSDWKEISEIPLMLIPGGSCNALSQNILNRSGESTSLKSCAYLIAKGRKMKSDLTVYELEDGRKIYSFLSLTWASPANIDLDSETLRSLGNVRFDVYGAWECLTLKKYKAKFFWSESNKMPPKFGEDPKGEEWEKVDDEFSYFSIHNMPWVGLHYEAIPFLDLGDGINYFLAQKGEQVTRKNLLKTRKLLRRNIDKIKGEEDLEALGMTVGRFKSFRLEPYGERQGKYSIDGEEYDVMPIQGYILEKAINFVGYAKNQE